MIDAPARILTWDSEFFGVKTARGNGPIMGDTGLRRLEEWCSKARVEWIHVLISAGDLVSIRQLEAARYSLVDIRMTLRRAECATNTSGLPNGAKALLRDHKSGDLEALVAIARTVHTDSRFFSDPRLPKALAAGLYEEWIRRSCSGVLADSVVVAEVDGAPVGYATGLMNDADCGAIGLVGVHHSVRGRGLGSALVYGVASKLASLGASEIEVVAQGRNVAALRLYQRLGFAIKSVELWYHQWFDP